MPALPHDRNTAAAGSRVPPQLQQPTALRTLMSLKIACGAGSFDRGLPSAGTVTFIMATIGVVSFPVMICARGFCGAW